MQSRYGYDVISNHNFVYLLSISMYLLNVKIFKGKLVRLLNSTISDDIPNIDASTFHRRAARAIVLNGDSILLLYTKRYHDYTLPGGGIDDGEEITAGLIRELKEETGAKNIRDITPFGLYEEFRPWYKNDAEILHMESFCYSCSIDSELGTPNFEDYEIKNGMEAKWVNIHEAIRHNEETIATSEKKGMSIERETFLLKRIVSELLN